MLLHALPTFLSIQKQLGVEPPLFIMLSMLGVRGYFLKPGFGHYPFWGDDAHPIDRDSLILPEIMINNFETDISKAMKPIFDTVWNAAGWPRSMNYDNDGKWKGR